MAKFFDPKQDVLDIQLTQYGKYLLSQGKMRPDSYSFYDNDIIYDSLYANVSESQNQTQDRIKNKTPRVRAQYVFHGIETGIKKTTQEVLNSKIDLYDSSLQPTADKAYSLNDALGTCDPNAENIAAWDVKFLKTPMSSSATYMTGNHQNINIPQLEAMYELNIKTISGSSDGSGVPSSNELDPQQQVLSEAYLDDSYFVAEHEYLFLDLKELNTVMGAENFDIEVFEIENETDGKTGATKEILKQLQFLPEEGNNLGLSNEAILKAQFPALNSSYVGYYFNIEVDEEISDQIFCEADFKYKSKDLFVDSERELNCIDLVTGLPPRYDDDIDEDKVCD
tara:strand:+ start:988 stop:2001 length:1014 start_codon:yes stop_codon:yes gene_type:complete